MPVNMAFGAPWAVYFLGFETITDENGRIRKVFSTNDPNKPMWQSKVGYNLAYDFFFSIGGPIYRNALEFQRTDENNETIYYVVWLWKGDYWNLGAGAEIGLYYTKSEEMYNLKFYDIDTALTMTVDMNIEYRALCLLPLPHYEERYLFNGHDDNAWWFCAFAPDCQLPNVNRIDVSMAVSFNSNPDYATSEELLDAFEERQISGIPSDIGDWSVVTIIAPENWQSEGCQFKINY